MSRAGTARSGWVWVLLVAVLLVVAAVVILVVWRPFPKAPARQPETVGTTQASAVAAFLKAYVKGDAAAIEQLVTKTSVPWTAPPPVLPPGVSTDTVASFIEPYRESDTVVIGSPLVLEIRLRGDGQQPRGTVSASVNARKQATRTLKVGVVLVNGKWLVDTIDGRPAAKAIASFSQ